MSKELFPFVTEKFLRDLSKNNNKEWFVKNKYRFENEFLIPASNFVVELGERIRHFAPNVIAIPKIDKSIFRLHRDMRFSKDKKPYKTNLGIYIWEGNKSRMECPGFYFHLEYGQIFFGSGIYRFSNEQLLKFREIISQEDNAIELDGLLTQITKNSEYKIGGSELKKTPNGYDKTYQYKKFFLHTGLYSHFEKPSLDDLKNVDIIEFSTKIFYDFNPLHQWLINNLIK
jgi:uncharacterized protein (TIGR02453 family)